MERAARIDPAGENPRTAHFRATSDSDFPPPAAIGISA
jgi:hypothetical protein